MLSSIKKIKNTGVFVDYTSDSNIDNFSRFNLLYGWNGSGKSTLTRIIGLFEHNTEQVNGYKEDFPESEFEIKFDKNILVDETSYASFEKYPVKVFNRDFVDLNFDWTGSTKSKILIISEEKIKERSALENEESTLTNLKNELIKAEGIRDELSNDKGKGKIEKFLSESAKKIKKEFLLLSPQDLRYLNYDRNKLRQIITDNESVIKDERALLKDGEVETLKKSSIPNNKEEIKSIIKNASINNWNLFVERLKALLLQSITSGVIQRLKVNPDIAQWVEAGKKLHEIHGKTRCEFCSKEISNERWKELEGHFSDEFTRLQVKIDKTLEWLTSNKLDVENLPQVGDLFEEFREEYLIEKDTLQNVNSFIEKIEKWVKAKQKNPMEVINIPETFDIESEVNAFNKKIKPIKTIIDDHNNKVRNFNASIKSSQNKLELHYANFYVKEHEYFQLLLAYQTVNAKCEDLTKKIKESERKVNKLQNQVSSEALGANEFNKLLAKFLGHEEIRLKFVENEGGYEIIRTHTRKKASNLSEGEKTAIAFVFFITKLHEKGNKLEDTIVIIDDPVSSFDSNSLFSASSFLQLECAAVKQLFVFTHNFSFFKIIRRWFVGSRNKELNKRARIFSVEIISFNPKKAIIKNADDTLINYDSEYHYIFSKLLHFRSIGIVTLDNAFLIANLSRKLLEAFLSFKYPKQRNDFATLLAKAFDKEHKQEEKKIYRFINNFSHMQKIDFYESSEDVQIGHYSNIADLVLETIKRVDKEHYNEMAEICT